jgi:Ca2+:H+ antiporter
MSASTDTASAPGLSRLPWPAIAPLAAWLVFLLTFWLEGPVATTLVAVALVCVVLAAVHHAEVVAHRVGEPFGTLVLAVSVTVIEVSLIVALMFSAGEAAPGLARDTVFAAVMLILTGMVGLSLLAGSVLHGEQAFEQRGVSAALATLAALSVLTLVLPNFTISVPGPYYSAGQLAFVAAVSLVLYGAFVLVQNFRHRDYFLAPDAVAGSGAAGEEAHAPRPSNRVAIRSVLLLLASLGAVVLLAEDLEPAAEAALERLNAPKAAVGVFIALLVLLPEGLAAFRAARANRLQTSLNLALGSALASIGLTIPTVAIISLANGWTLALGLDDKSTVLLGLSLLVTTLSLGTGRTTVLQGTVHLVICAVYLFTTIVP